MIDERIDWRELPTEAVHPAARDLDSLSSESAVALLLEEDRRGLERVIDHSSALAAVADRVAETLAAGGDLVMVGAGTSGRLAVLEAAECPPTFGTDPERIRAEIAGGDQAVFRAREGSEDREDLGREVGAALRPTDLLIGLSASSVTPYTRGALAGARERGAETVLLTCASLEREPALAKIADRVIALDTGPEVLAGSTRLKAGSATKAALNAITTVAMIRLGKVYGSYMVDLRAGSAKLVDRAARIVEAAAEVTNEKAKELLDEADGEVKSAIVMARLGVSVEEARRVLEQAAGSISRALASPRTQG